MFVIKFHFFSVISIIRGLEDDHLGADLNFSHFMAEQRVHFFSLSLPNLLCKLPLFDVCAAFCYNI